MNRTFDSYGFFLASNFFPSLFAKKGLEARERLAKAFELYIKAGNDKQACPAIRSTISIMHEHGISQNDHARLEIENLFVAIVNTTPTTLWLVINVLADHDLLQQLREEIHKSIITQLPVREAGGEINRRFQIDVTQVSTTCPLLYATYQEALRVGSIPTCNRIALEDTVLTDPIDDQTILIRKGNRIVVPTYMLHFHHDTWGSDASTFSPNHFLAGSKASTPKNDVSTKEKDRSTRKARNESFIPYGGGIHLCPGRHFAQLEIFATAALMIVALDCQREDGEPIEMPEIKIVNGTMRPATPMMVKMKKRKGWEDVSWSVKA